MKRVDTSTPRVCSWYDQIQSKCKGLNGSVSILKYELYLYHDYDYDYDVFLAWPGTVLFSPLMQLRIYIFPMTSPGSWKLLWGHVDGSWPATLNRSNSWFATSIARWMQLGLWSHRVLMCATVLSAKCVCLGHFGTILEGQTVGQLAVFQSFATICWRTGLRIWNQSWFFSRFSRDVKCGWHLTLDICTVGEWLQVSPQTVDTS